MLILSSILLFLLLCPTQSEKQRKISHAELTSDYPRYPNLDKAIKDLTTTERHMLMVKWLHVDQL